MSFSKIQFDLSKPPASSFDFQVGDSNSVDTVEDPALVKVKKEWLKRAEELPSQNRDPFKQYIDSIWRGVSRTISQTSQLKRIASNTLDDSTSLVQKLNSEAERRFKQYKTNTEKQGEVEQSLQNSISKLENLQLSLNPFSLKLFGEKAPEKPSWRTRLADIRKAEEKLRKRGEELKKLDEQSEFMKSMARTHVVTKILEGTSKIVTVPIDMLGEAASYIHDKSTTVQIVCAEGETILKPIAETTANVLQQTGISEFCERMHDEHTRLNQQLAKDLSEKHSIPLHYTEQYINQGETLFGIGIPMKIYESVSASKTDEVIEKIDKLQPPKE